MDNNIQQELNVLLKRRLEELAELKNKGFQTFAYSFDVDSNSKEIKDNYLKRFDEIKNELHKVQESVVRIETSLKYIVKIDDPRI